VKKDEKKGKNDLEDEQLTIPSDQRRASPWWTEVWGQVEEGQHPSTNSAVQYIKFSRWTFL